MNRLRFMMILGIGCFAANPSLADSETSAYLKEREALKDCPGDDGQSVDECRATAEGMVEQRHNHMEHSLAVLSLLTDESLPTLRKLVQDSPIDDFHWGAVAALAHMGDSGIVSHLQERQQQFKKAGDDRSAGTIGFYLWKIDIQKTHESLLAYIAAKPEIRVEERLWAIQRAHDLTIPKANIRKAILDHAAQTKTNEHGIRPGLSSIKHVGQSLEILHADDLPAIKTEFPCSP